ncbi:MAG: PA14 domain-containing protein [Terracidiphilus sp.]
MRKYLFALAAIALCVPKPLSIAAPRTQRTPAAENAENPQSPNEPEFTTLRVTTREVLVDLIALDRRNQPVLDLKPAELQVSEAAEFETTKKRKHRAFRSIASQSSEPISSFSIVDPTKSPSSKNDAETGVRIATSCLERSTVHYLLAFHPGPDGWTSGHHRIAISSSRPRIKLFYRHEYYVGLAVPPPDAPVLKKETIDQILRQSACYYPVTPLSFTLQASLVNTGRTDVFRYLVTLDASSLSFLTLHSDPEDRGFTGIDRRVDLDYGICNFDDTGHPISYYHAPLEKILTSADYARTLDRGFPHLLEFPASKRIALTRVVARDRATGNLGAVDVTLAQSETAPASEGSSADSQTAADLKTYQDRLNIEWGSGTHKQPSAWIHDVAGPIGSFGSIVASPHSFCGDVYELPDASARLPDFRALDPIGAIYTSSLDVPNQTFSNTSGIPGVTPRTNLFGIDYHAAFWVQDAGEYQFLMASDDGAILQIDDQAVIDLDGLHSVNAGAAHVQLDQGLHTIHVPYYQGAVDSVALELWVRKPGATDWVLFNLSDYSAPGSKAN